VRHSCSGFTLIETIIATGILVIASAAIATLFVASSRTGQLNRQRAVAAILASDKIEELTAAGSPQNGSDAPLGLKRDWQVSDAATRTFTVIVFDFAGRELIRCSAGVSAAW
jgi:prepilin-type N-terminal cleavage/methylation domain-containing protein